MKATIILLLASLVSLLSFGQEANWLHHPANRTQPVSLRELTDTATTNSVGISITDIQSPGEDYVDLAYIVYVRLYTVKDDVSKPVLLDELELDLDIEITGKNTVSLAADSYNESFTLNINPDKDESRLAFHFGKNNLLSPFDLFNLEVATISFNLNQLDTSAIELSTIFLELYIDRFRYFIEANNEIVPKFYAYDLGNQYNELKKNETAVSWQEGAQPSSYELEWVHVPSNDPSSKDSVTVDFSKNAVRINTRKNYIPMNMLHAPGHIVVRGRSKRPLLNYDSTAIADRFEYSNWSMNDEETIAVSDEAVLEIDYSNSSPLGAINWQYNSTYANDSKKKEIVNYFDGSQRSRQSTTLLNDFSGKTLLGDTSTYIKNSSTLISKESYYDYNGNAVIDLLPSPIIGTNNIDFQSNLNIFGLDKLVKVNYDELNVDSIPELNPDSNGAVQYYSSQNQLLGVDSNASFIPNANGYPYTRTEYVKDGSGRIKAQYGLGSELAKDETKGTRYAYAKPTTSELEFLFGTNIGLANFYKKNVSIDPNGIMSIAYVDINGNTVATSVAGIPEGRSKMDTISAPKRNFSEDLLLTGADQFYEQNNSYELSYPIFVTASSVYEFEYGFNLEPYEACSNVNVCFGCRYQLLFQIVDDNNKVVLEAVDNELEFAHTTCLEESYSIDSINYSDPGVNASVSSGIISIELSAQKQYTIIKKLNLLKDELELDAQYYLDSSACEFLDYEYFLTNELDSMDCSVCTTEQEELSLADPCRLIREGLRADFKWPGGEFTKDAVASDEFLPYIYDRLLRVSGCQNLERISLYTFKNIFLAKYGESIGLTFADYRDEYIDFLIHFHPTYCQLPVCEQYHTEETILFDQLLTRSNSAEEFTLMAKNAGFIKEDTSRIFFSPDSFLTANYVIDSIGADSIVSDTLLMRYDPIMRPFMVDSLIYNFTNKYFAQDSAVVYYSPHFNRVIRECNTPPTITPPTINDSNYYYSYFKDIPRGCNESGEKLGISLLAKYYSSKGALEGIAEDARWEYYRNLYLIAKNSFVDDMLSSITCFNNVEITDSINPEFPYNTIYDTNIVPIDCHDSVTYYHYPSYSYDSAISYGSKYKHFLGTRGIENGMLIARGEDPAELLDSLENAVNQINITVGNQVFQLLMAFECIDPIDSADFVNRIDADLIIASPFQYLDTLTDSTGIRLLTCDPWQINFSSTLSPFREFYEDTLGNQLFTFGGGLKEQVNCKDFKQVHQGFVVYFHVDSVPSITTISDIDINNTQQRRYVNYMNYELGLNLAFYDYYQFANHCTANESVSLFGDTINRTDTGIVAALKEVIISNDSSYYTSLETDSLFGILNEGLSGSPYTLTDSLDYIGIGEPNMQQNELYVYFLENNVERYNNLLDTLNWVFFTVKDYIGALSDIEDTTNAYCRGFNSNLSIDSANNIFISRYSQYSNGTVWVRLLNTSDSSFYNDIYFYYKANNYLYKMSSVIDSFSAIQPIFDQVEMHYAKLSFSYDSLGLEMIIKTSKQISMAEKLCKVELDDYQGRGEFPLYETCEDLIYAKAKAQAKIKYNEYLNGIKDTFKLNYISFCTNKAADSSFKNQYLRLNYQSSEKQFTLYYYDQANNLVMTVPPGGVDVSFPYNSTQQQQIKDYREGAAGEVLPSHEKRTTYKYNSNNQIVKSKTPNGNTSYFWYDKADRLVLSQNEIQAPLNIYSHTLYDEQSRIIETGEVEINDFSGSSWDTIQAVIIKELLNGNPIDLDSVFKSKPRSQVTRTYYDAAILDESNGINQYNLRSRVAAQAYYPSFSNEHDEENWQYAIHYSYDPTGNVKTIINDFYQKGEIALSNHRFKRIDYKYDVLSGNVNQVYYQTGQEDAFFHRYDYDAENRITKVETSRDGILWDLDATYEYYLHGPLARTELGNQKVQGLDYSYTIQGFLKSVNSGHKNADMGNDGAKSSILGADAFGMALQYNENDYTSIGSINDYLISSTLGDSLSALYNGNISAITQHNQDSTFGKAYVYDQLNRIRLMQEHYIDEDTLKWDGLKTNGNRSFYEYDKNGNLLELIREDGASERVMDKFTYNYIEETDQLSSVDDTVSPAAFVQDIDQQVSNNYSYDAIGNLVSDSAEGIGKIRWYANGKVKRIVRINPTEQRPNLFFEYDPLGNRVKKQVSFLKNAQTFIRSTYYVRDAQGNIMASYEERDCDFYGGDDSLGLYYYQFTEDYAYYTNEAISQIGLNELMTYLNDTFPLKTELCEEAFLNLYLVDSIRDTIMDDLIVADYISLYPGAVGRVIAEDPISYANDLFNNEQAAFISAMNFDNDAWIVDMTINNRFGGFYNSLDALYTGTYGTNTEADKFFETNKDVVEEAYTLGSTTLTKNLLEVNSTQYSMLTSFLGNHSLALDSMLSWMNALQSNLQSMNNTQTTYDLIDQVSATLLFIDFSTSDLSYILQGINNQSAFYSSSGWLPASNAAKLTAAMYHFYYIGSSTFNIAALGNYAPTASMDWSADFDGSMLKHLIKISVADASVLSLFYSSSYYNTGNLPVSDLYFSDSTTLRTYAYDQLIYYSLNLSTSFGLKVKNSVIDLNLNSLAILDELEELMALMNYYKNYHPKKVLLQNYYVDSLNASLGGILGYTPYDYADQLRTELGVSFNLSPVCTSSQAYLVPEQFTIYGSSRLGVMNAKKKRKDGDNQYSRKLGAKEYELSDHLGNVVATISDKKIHPQELVTNGNHAIDTTIGFQADVTGRYDYYPFGMEIMSRSGDFTMVDYTTDVTKILYDGLLKSCDSYDIYPEALNTDEKYCVTAENLYGQNYVDTIRIDHLADASWNGMRKFDFYINLKLNEVIPSLDTLGEYRIEFSFNSKHRRVRGIEPWAGVESSVSAGPSATLSQIQAATDKVLTFNLSGFELDSVAANGVVEFRVRATWGTSGQNWDKFAEITNIRVTQIFNNESVPLAMRDGSAYSYGFNGMERDDEVKGSGNSYDFGARIYDPRLGRFLSIDPRAKEFPSWSPYLFAANNPIRLIDVDGKGPGDGTKRLWVTKIEVPTKNGVQTAYLKKVYYENATPAQVAQYNQSAKTPNGWYLSTKAEYDQFQKDPTQGAFQSKVRGADTPEKPNRFQNQDANLSRMVPENPVGKLTVSLDGEGSASYGYYDADENQVELGTLTAGEEGASVTLDFDVREGDGGLYVTPNTSADVTTSAGATTQGSRGQNRQDNMGDYGNEEPAEEDVKAVGKILDDRQ